MAYPYFTPNRKVKPNLGYAMPGVREMFERQQAMALAKARTVQNRGGGRIIKNDQAAQGGTNQTSPITDTLTSQLGKAAWKKFNAAPAAASPAGGVYTPQSFGEGVGPGGGGPFDAPVFGDTPGFGPGATNVYDAPGAIPPWDAGAELAQLQAGGFDLSGLAGPGGALPEFNLAGAGALDAGIAPAMNLAGLSEVGAAADLAATAAAAESATAGLLGAELGAGGLLGASAVPIAIPGATAAAATAATAAGATAAGAGAATLGATAALPALASNPVGWAALAGLALGSIFDIW